MPTEEDLKNTVWQTEYMRQFAINRTVAEKLSSVAKTAETSKASGSTADKTTDTSAISATTAKDAAVQSIDRNDVAEKQTQISPNANTATSTRNEASTLTSPVLSINTKDVTVQKTLASPAPLNSSTHSKDVATSTTKLNAQGVKNNGDNTKASNTSPAVVSTAVQVTKEAWKPAGTNAAPAKNVIYPSTKYTTSYKNTFVPPSEQASAVIPVSLKAANEQKEDAKYINPQKRPVEPVYHQRIMAPFGIGNSNPINSTNLHRTFNVRAPASQVYPTTLKSYKRSQSRAGTTQNTVAATPAEMSKEDAMKAYMDSKRQVDLLAARYRSEYSQQFQNWSMPLEERLKKAARELIELQNMPAAGISSKFLHRNDFGIQDQNVQGANTTAFERQPVDYIKVQSVYNNGKYSGPYGQPPKPPVLVPAAGERVKGWHQRKQFDQEALNAERASRILKQI